ncbi:aldo/keto reductase [Thermophilibacter immobilis]|jgi:diketogulonate reductase-like aldo/keto reductase|uniref:Aldo/keto reductase n=1 Tax=Thermophilibacter immobilis TaxID=2779519 RepID=A0A7S7M8P8_9ACTN|nr:aldo/keto reductase [Thermophilibacter immobilis]QOY60804.1 aldo/keto reductase [Thermophilibacter immobilis]
MDTATLKLNNGIVIPTLGFGTWLIPNDQAADTVCCALKSGYHHIDTAQGYGNEEGVGRGLRQSGVAREDVFVTTKVAAGLKGYDSTAASIDESLAKLGLDSLDLLLIHSPQPWDAYGSDDRYLAGNRETWRAMEDAVGAGKVRSIGVSNFQVGDLQNILGVCHIKPAANQIRAHVGAMPFELIDWCRAREIVVEAYSPIAHGATLANAALAAMADRYDAGVGRLCVRYCLQHDLVALPKAANPDHIRANAQLDFTISDEDMAALDAVDPIADYERDERFPAFHGRL